jgi:hypothetical protein
MTVAHRRCTICWARRAIWVGLVGLLQLPVALAVDHWIVDLHGYAIWAVFVFLAGGVLLIGGMAVASLTN